MVAILEAGHPLPFAVQPSAMDLPELQVGGWVGGVGYVCRCLTHTAALPAPACTAGTAAGIPLQCCNALPADKLSRYAPCFRASRRRLLRKSAAWRRSSWERQVSPRGQVVQSWLGQHDGCHFAAAWTFDFHPPCSGSLTLTNLLPCCSNSNCSDGGGHVPVLQCAQGPAGALHQALPAQTGP